MSQAILPNIQLSRTEISLISRAYPILSLSAIRSILREMEQKLGEKARLSLEENSPYLSTFSTQAVLIARQSLLSHFFQLFDVNDMEQFLCQAIEEIYNSCVPMFVSQNQRCLFFGPDTRQIVDILRRELLAYCPVVDIKNSNEASGFAIWSIARLHIRHLRSQISSSCRQVLVQIHSGIQPFDSILPLNYVYWVALQQRPRNLPEPGWVVQYEASFQGIPYEDMLVRSVFEVYATIIGLRDVLLGNTNRLVSDPLVMVWMRSVVKEIYKYQTESYTNESQFLVEMSAVAAQELKQRNIQSPILMDYNRDCEISYLTYSESVSTILFFPGTYSDHNQIQKHFAEKKLFSASICVFGWNLPRRLQKWSVLPYDIITDVIKSVAQGSFQIARNIFPSILKVIPKAIIVALEESDTELTTGIESGSEALIRLFESQFFSNRFVSFLCSDFGAEVALTSLEKIAHANTNRADPQKVYIDSILMILPLTRLRDVQWNQVKSVVRGRIVVAYFNSYVHRVMITALGLEAWEQITTCGEVESFDVTDLLTSGFMKIAKQSPINDEMIADIVERTAFYP